MTTRRLVILGASGDLTGRYLLPALAELTEARLLPGDLDIIGIARDDWDDTTFRRHAEVRLGEHAAQLPRVGRDDLVARLRYRRGDAANVDTLHGAISGATGPVLVYLALPPFVFAPATASLAAAGLSAQDRIVVEKPFGTDLASASDLNALLHAHFREEAVLRIDHFLGMQAVQNMLGLRFANRLFEPLWYAERIEAVDIIWEETVALEGRAGYYDHTGALRDIVQNHLLQLLTFVAKERPAGLTERPLRDAKVDVLRAVQTLDDDAVHARTVAAGTRLATSTAPRSRLQGRARHRPRPRHRDLRRDPSHRGQRPVARSAVPSAHRQGPRPRPPRDHPHQFRPAAHLPFGQPDDPMPNVVTLGMDPDRLTANIALNGDGDPFCLEAARIARDLAPQDLSAHARLLVDALEGDPALATRGDEAEEAWRIVEPIIDAWQRDVAPVTGYAAGTTGPPGAPTAAGLEAEFSPPPSPETPLP